MEKRNTILLTVIAVATLLVAVVGATFAYFAGTVQNTNVLEITGTTESANSLFDVVGDTISFTVYAAKMQESIAANQDVIADQNPTAELEVSYLSGTETSIQCTYDIMYQWVTGSNGYTITDASKNSGKEFTYEMTGTTGAASKEETNFVAGATTAAQLVASDSITNASKSQATEKTYTVTAHFYNLQGANQTPNADKTFKVRFFVDNIQCGTAA